MGGGQLFVYAPPPPPSPPQLPPPPDERKRKEKGKAALAGRKKDFGVAQLAVSLWVLLGWRRRRRWPEAEAGARWDLTL